MNVNDFMMYDIIIVAIISIIFYAIGFYMWFGDVFKFPLKQMPKQLKKEIKEIWNCFNKFLVVLMVFGFIVGIPILAQLLVGFAFVGFLVGGNFLLWLFALL